MIDQLFKVPNDEEGRFFIHQLRKYLSPDIRIRVRGRNPDYAKAKKLGYTCKFWDSMPQSVARELGIYLQVKNGNGLVNIGASTVKYLSQNRNDTYRIGKAVREARMILTQAQTALDCVA